MVHEEGGQGRGARRQRGSEGKRSCMQTRAVSVWTTKMTRHVKTNECDGRRGREHVGGCAVSMSGIGQHYIISLTPFPEI